MRLPAPKGWGSFDVEPFSSYRLRWPAKHSRIPETVVENWIYRHWRDFQAWLPLNPLAWSYEIRDVSNAEIMTIRHVGDWMRTLDYWGDDLLDGHTRKGTWLGRYMLENGTTPAPIIVLAHAASMPHPREHDVPMCEPYQLIEGHMRLAYLRGMIRREHGPLRIFHQIVVATLPSNRSVDTGTQQLGTAKRASERAPRGVKPLRALTSNGKPQNADC